MSVAGLVSTVWAIVTLTMLQVEGFNTGILLADRSHTAVAISNVGGHAEDERTSHIAEEGHYLRHVPYHVFYPNALEQEM